MFFTNLGQVYKSRVAEFDDTKASVMGDYVAGKLGMDTGEVPVYMALYTKYEGYMLFVFENGKAAKVEMGSYETKTRRKKHIFIIGKSLFFCYFDYIVVIRTCHTLIG